MANFDKKSGVVQCRTPWGCWYQSIDELMVEIDVPEGIRSKEIKVDFKFNHLMWRVRDAEIKGELFNRVIPDECLWSLEDRKLLRIVLVKSDRQAGNCWRSLFKNQYEADPMTFDQMEKKMTLQRFQYEHPGFDFSGADISGNYSGGGPQLPGD